jgi:hypothetical protein
MKHIRTSLHFTGLLTCIFLLFSCTKNSNAKQSSQEVLDKWKINPSANFFKKEYTEVEGSSYAFKLTNNSLCPVYGAKAIIKVNGTEVVNKVAVTGIEEIVFPVLPNSKVEVQTELFDRSSQTICVWGGEAEFELKK